MIATLVVEKQWVLPDRDFRNPITTAGAYEADEESRDPGTGCRMTPAARLLHDTGEGTYRLPPCPGLLRQG